MQWIGFQSQFFKFKDSAKLNPVSVRRQIDYMFQQLWGKVI